MGGFEVLRERRKRPDKGVEEKGQGADAARRSSGESPAYQALNYQIGQTFDAERSEVRAEVRPRLEVSSPGDAYEQEADRVAEQITRGSDGAIAPNRAGLATPQSLAPPESSLKSLGHGFPMDASTRSLMESHFGYDFSQVRIHADERAALSADAINALAYTAGRDVVFGNGRYAPGTRDGQRLLAHELTHVIQQAGTRLLRQAGATDEGSSAAANNARNVNVTTIDDADMGDVVSFVGTAGEEAPGQVQGSIMLTKAPGGPPVQRQGEEVAGGEATKFVAEKSYEILKSAVEEGLKGDVHYNGPSSTIGVHYTGDAAKYRVNTRTREKEIMSFEEELGVGVEAANVKVIATAQWNGPEVEVSFQIPAGGNRSRLGDDTTITIGQPLSLETKPFPPRALAMGWGKSGISSYPVVRIPISMFVDRPWPLSNYNFSAFLVVSGIYGFGADGLKTKEGVREVWD